MHVQLLLLLVCTLGASALVKIDAPHSVSKYLELRSLLLNPVRRQVIVDQGFKDDAISSHNTARSGVVPAATNMHTAVWNEDLALTAQNYANKCLWVHNQNRKSETANRVWSPDSVGENLYYHSATMSDRDHMKEAVRLWDEEKQYYNYDTLACSKAPCGHYTQVVWHNSANVGCGIKYCSSIVIDGKVRSGTVVVCNYGSAGNYVGQKPYSTDSSVTPCTNNPCLHGGICSASGSSYTCSCTSAYTGVNCHVATICATASCQNGGKCSPSADGTSYTCLCLPGFTGSSCETAVPCDSQPCQNGGTCTADGATYTCSCETGFAGTNCESALTTGELRCGFETDMCGFTQTITSFDWRRRQGTTPSSNTGPTSASEGQYYVYTEVSGPWGQGSNAVLTSGITFGDGPWCLKFDYNMYGSSIGQLDVLAGNNVIWSRSGNQGNQWTTVEVHASQLANEKLSFKGTYGGTWQGDIAVDNIIVTPGSCSSACASQPCNNGGTCTPSGSSFTCTCTSTFTGPTCDTTASVISSFDCDYSSGLCGMTQLSNDDMDFVHDTSNQYIVIDYTMGNSGDYATAETLPFSASGPYCVEIVSNIKGSGSIEIGSGGSSIYTIGPRDSEYWYTFRLNLSSGGYFLNNKKLYIKALLGNAPDTYVAISSLSVTSGECAQFKKRELGAEADEKRIFNVMITRNKKLNNKKVDTRRLQLKQRLLRELLLK